MVSALVYLAVCASGSGFLYSTYSLNLASLSSSLVNSFLQVITSVHLILFSNTSFSFLFFSCFMSDFFCSFFLSALLSSHGISMIFSTLRILLMK